jgi:hypothetical protein
MLSGAFLSNVGLDHAGLEETKQYLDERMAISNWYHLSLVLGTEEAILPYWTDGYQYNGIENSSLGSLEKKSPSHEGLWPIIAVVCCAAAVFIIFRRQGSAAEK